MGPPNPSQAENTYHFRHGKGHFKGILTKVAIFSRSKIGLRNKSEAVLNTQRSTNELSIWVHCSSNRLNGWMGLNKIQKREKGELWERSEGKDFH